MGLLEGLWEGILILFVSLNCKLKNTFLRAYYVQ